MKHLRAILVLLGMALAAASHAAERPEPELTVEAVSPEGQFDYDLATGVATASGGVRVRYGEATLTARRVMLNQGAGRVFAEGQVRIQQEGMVWVGDSVTYDFQRRQINADLFRTGQTPIFATGEVVTTDPTNKAYIAKGAFITTDDYAEPLQRIRASQIKIIPGQYVEARHATLYYGKVPVFYWPYYRRFLKRHPNYFQFTPGYRGRFGPFLLGSYHWHGSDYFDGTLHLDYRQKRGLGLGPDVNFHLGKYGEGQFKYYYAPDADPGTNFVTGAKIDSDRQRLSYLHRATLSSNLTAQLVVRYQSDAQVVRDFFEAEYRRNVQPGSYLELNQRWSNFSLDWLAQPRLNRFYDTVERLPDLKLTGFRQQLAETPLYYESESSLGWFRRRHARQPALDFAAWRGDTFHQLLLPYNFFGWLNFTPRVGGRYTGYSAASGPGAVTTSESRFVFNTGAELSFKTWRVWPGVRNHWLDVNGLRHIVQPSFNYVYVPAPSARPPALPQFDYELDSYRLPPIDFPDYTAIDAIDAQHVLRLGLWNKLQTKRAGGIDNLVNWGLFTDWRLAPRAGQGTFADVFSDLDFRPRSWLTLGQSTRYDVTRWRLRELSHRLTLLPGDTWSVTLGNRYLLPNFGEYASQNIFFTSLFYRVNENWALRMSHHFEARDGVMEEQYYTLYRDLRSWTAALTFRVRGHRGGADEFAVALTLSLKAFPRFGLGEDADQPSLLLGG